MKTGEEWQEFATYTDAASAEVMASLLRSEAVPVQVVSDEPVPGLFKSARLMVPAGMLHRAQWIARQAQLSDEELNFLATGERGDDDPKDPSNS